LTAIEFSGISKAFGRTQVLKDVSFSLPEAQTTAVIGESGSGKSTLLQMINAVYRPDSGTISVFGESIPEKSVWEFRRKIGYAVQGAGLFPHMLAYDNISLLARLENWSETDISKRVTQLLSTMGLSPELARKFPGQLSGGQQQRVGLCRALMLHPRLLLLDEPFSALDPMTRQDLHKHFLASKEVAGTTTILVTHDMQEAVELASYMVILSSGRVLQVGTVEEILAAPVNSYVEELVSLSRS